MVRIEDFHIQYDQKWSVYGPGDLVTGKVINHEKLSFFRLLSELSHTAKHQCFSNFRCKLLLFKSEKWKFLLVGEKWLNGLMISKVVRRCRIKNFFAGGQIIVLNVFFADFSPIERPSFLRHGTGSFLRVFSGILGQSRMSGR